MVFPALETTRVTETVLVPIGLLLMPTPLYPANVTFPLYVPLASPFTTDELDVIIAVLVEKPEAPFVTVPLDGVTTNQLPPLVVDVVAVHVNAEYGAPLSVTVIVWLCEDGVREVEPGLTCMFALGVQRIVNVAEGMLGVKVCVSDGLTVYANATVLNILFNESPNDPRILLFFFSAIGARSME
jgi:hypothetical protein